MKRITLGALDYGVSFGVDRTLRQLLLERRLSAVGCLVASSLWSREFKPLQEVADEVGDKALIGVTLAFSGDRVAPVSERMQQVYGPVMPSRTKWVHRSFLRLLPDEILRAEAHAQLDRFVSLMEREPAIIAVRDGLLARSALARLVIDTIAECGFKTPPLLICPVQSRRTHARLSARAAPKGLKVLPRGPSLPETDNPEELQVRLEHHFDGLADMTFVASIPGRADKRLRRDEPQEKIAIRECQREVLASGRFFRTLVAKDVFLH